MQSALNRIIVTVQKTLLAERLLDVGLVGQKCSGKRPNVFLIKNATWVEVPVFVKIFDLSITLKA